MKRGILLVLLIGLMAGTSQAAVTTYQDDLAGFLANSSTTLIDFEDIGLETTNSNSVLSRKVINGVTFSTTS